jgi:hypothetical protein
MRISNVQSSIHDDIWKGNKNTDGLLAHSTGDWAQQEVSSSYSQVRNKLAPIHEEVCWAASILLWISPDQRTNQANAQASAHWGIGDVT